MAEARREVAAADRAIGAAQRARSEYLEKNPHIVHRFIGQRPEDCGLIVQQDEGLRRLDAALSQAKKSFHAALAQHAVAKREGQNTEVSQ